MCNTQTQIRIFVEFLVPQLFSTRDCSTIWAIYSAFSILREIIKAEWCQIVKLNLYVTYYVMIKFCVHCPNVSTTPIRAMECRQCLPLSVVQLKGKPHRLNGVVDTSGHSQLLMSNHIPVERSLVAILCSILVRYFIHMRLNVNGSIFL